VTLTANVAAPGTSSTDKRAIPAGEMEAFSGITGGGSTLLGSAPLDSAGVAQLPATSPGPHALKAVYSGNATFSSTGTLSESVSSTKTTAHAYLVASANPALIGQSITFTVYVYGTTSEQGGATGSVTLTDGTSTTPLASGPLSGAKATFTVSSLSAGTHAITASYGGDGNFTAATSSILTETIGPPGSIRGTATALNTQDTLNVNVHSSVTGGAASYSGSLSFSDRSAGDTFTATAITSLQIYRADAPAGGSASGAYSYFRITDTATLNDGTSNAYSFVIAVALPVAGTTNSPGYLTVTITGPGGFSYSAQAKALDAGSTIVITA
jgi:hypothetical protein